MTLTDFRLDMSPSQPIELAAPQRTLPNFHIRTIPSTIARKPRRCSVSALRKGIINANWDKGADPAYLARNAYILDVSGSWIFKTALNLHCNCGETAADLPLDVECVEYLFSTPFHKYDHVCCVDFRFWRGATREHPPQWGCDRGATKPEPKSDATLRAAVLFGPDVVARSSQTPEGYARRSRLVWAKNPSPQTWLYL